MISTDKIDISKLKISSALIVKEALRRGWKVRIAYGTTSLIFINRGYGDVIRIFSTTPPTVSAVNARIADDKLATHILLQDASMPVMDTIMISTSDSLNEVESMLKTGTVVVKPIDSSHGNGITTQIDNLESINDAINYAKKYSNTDAVIIQKMYINPIDIRILCIDREVKAASIRVPARVTGDGLHSVGDLIKYENLYKRGEPYKSDLAYIDDERAKQYLGKKINDIPALKEKYTVSGAANIGKGGESIDCTDSLPEWLKKMALIIAEISQLPVCGVDFMISKLPETSDTFENLKPVVTEVNKSPSLGLHQNPTTGKSRDVAKHYLDYLAKL